MSTRYRRPALLQPYLGIPPEQSLVLLTGTLECSANWLTTRFVGMLIADSDDSNVTLPTAVVFASLSRDEAFWRSEVLRNTGVDTSKLTSAKRFAFVDLFSSLASESPPLDNVEASVEAAIDKVSSADITRRVYLIIDSIDLMLSVSPSTASESLGMLHRLRRNIYAAVVTCSADSPFAAAASEPPDVRHRPIAAQSASLLSSLGHSARFVMSVRPLDTGAARDVSGVLRVTRGGGYYTLGKAGSQNVEDLEALYLVRRDGSIDVFGQRSSR